MKHHVKYDVLGIGAPVVDYIVHIDDQFLKDQNIEKGGMVLIEEPTFWRLLERTGKTPIRIAGGSAANTIKGISKLNTRCGFVGKIGGDEPGKFFSEHFKYNQIHPHLIHTEHHTAKALTLITPDGQRTFRTFIGAGMRLNAQDIAGDFYGNVKLVHLEGYLLKNGDLVEKAMAMAKEAGAKVSMDISSFEIVNEYKSRLVKLVANYVDVLFANEQETAALTGGRTPEEGVEIVRDICETVVLFQGPEGCWVGQGIKKVHCPAFPVTPVDTIGAGDMFAAGFLHGYLQGLPVETCARYGALTGRAVVSSVGADINEKEWERVFREI